MLTVALDARLAGGDRTGDSTYWTGLLSGLARQREDFRILLFSNTARPVGIPEDRRFQWIDLPGASGRWWSMVTFPVAARRAGAQVFHTQYSLSPLTGQKGVSTVHDVSFLIGPEWFRPRDRILLRAGVGATARRAARLITVSQTSRREIEQHLPAARGRVVAIPNACPEWITPIDPQEARRWVAEQYGIHGPYLLTVGTRWPRKNMELAIRAVEGLATDHRLLVTGKPGWGDQTAPGRALATGYVPNEHLGILYSGADVYLAPSRHEGFGIPVLEAFRCGCPVLASSGGALPEVVGDAGVIEGSWESPVWTRTLEGLLADPSKLAAMRERGRKREKLFSWEETARQTLAVYREVAG